jgi:hypothetical protein
MSTPSVLDPADGPVAASDPRVGLPDSLVPLVAMHDAMRRDARRLRGAIDRRPDVAAAERMGASFGRITEVILHHHRCEDEILWPALERWVPDFAEAAAHLVDDHHHLDDALDDIATCLSRLAGRSGVPTEADRLAAAAAAERFEDVLDRHLTAEEAVVIPAVRDLVPAASFEQITDEIDRTATVHLAAFALPWILDDAAPERVAVLSNDLPLPFRLLNRLVWARSYRRASMNG